MKRVKIFTDSCCDILYQIGDRKIDLSDVEIIPLNVTFEQETYRDYFDLASREIIKKGKELKMLPKTSAPSIGLFLESFKKYVENDCDIIYISLGSKFSSTYVNACKAAEEFPEGSVNVVDSNTLSSAIGLKVIKALELVKEGKNTEEIVSYLNSLNTKVHCEFACDTLEYIYKGGRCSGAAYLIGSMLRIKPLIYVDQEGVMTVGPKGLGKKQALKLLVSRFSDHYLNNEVDDKIVVITSFMADEEAEIIYDSLISLGISKENILRTEACGTVASHCGPGCLGIIYLEK